jgi:hypothetical protein
VTADVFDRLLEHALRDELAPNAPPASTADLVARVTAVLAGRDARRSPAPPMRHAGERARRRWLPYAIAAAAGVGVALTWLAAKQPGLSCSRALLLATADDQPFTAGTHVAAASFAWCTGAAAVVLTAGDGTEATVAPGSVFAIDPQQRSAELLAGALELRGRRAPWRVDVAGAGAGDVAVFVADGCAVRCTLTPEVPPQTDRNDPTMTPNELCARLRDLAVPATLTVLVLAGTAELATGQDKEPLPAGSSRTIDVGAERAALARTRQLYEQVRKELPPPNDEASIAARKELEDGFQELMVLALQRPRCAAMLRGPITQDLADVRLAAEPRARVLQLALLDEDPTTFAAVTHVWSLHPDRFGFEEQVALAERGFEPAKAKLRESLAQPRGVVIARVLAALTSGGDEEARVALRRFLRPNVTDAGKESPRFDARFHAAAAMQAIGDPAPAQELRTALIAQVETWAASGDAQQLAVADWCLQRAEYWLGSQQPRLSWPEIRQRAATPRRGEPDAASLRARAAALPAK